MVDIDALHSLLDEIAETLPPDFYRGLTGGILLSPETRRHAPPLDELLILGQYHANQMGRYITLYYGSIMERYPQASLEALRKPLRKLLLHEFTHHLESLAGERSLEVRDARFIGRYRHGQDGDA